MAFKQLEKPIYWIGLENENLMQKTFREYSDSAYTMLKDEEGNVRAFGFRARNNFDKILQIGSNYYMYSYEPINVHDFLDKIVKLQTEYIQDQYKKASKMVEKLTMTKELRGKYKE